MEKQITHEEARKELETIKEDCCVNETWPYGGSSWLSYQSDEPYVEYYKKTVDNLSVYITQQEKVSKLLVLKQRKIDYLQKKIPNFQIWKDDKWITDFDRLELEIKELERELNEHI